MDYVAATNNPMAGLPSYRELYGVGEIESAMQDSVFSDLKFDNLPRKRTFSRIPTAGLVFLALNPAGAAGVDQAEFRMRAEYKSVETPLAQSLPELR